MLDRSKENKGITLIALVITIIVLLILAGVAISMLSGENGILRQAANARDGYQKAQSKESDTLQNYDDYITKNTGGIVKPKGNWKLSEDGNTVMSKGVTLKIGDYVNYTPNPETSIYKSSRLDPEYTGSTDNNVDLTTQTELKWRVLGVDENGCLTLISDKPTNKSVCLKGAKGYNNGVYILNDICRSLYSNSELDVMARSLAIEDIEAGLSDIGKEEIKNYKGEIQYGSSKTYGRGNLQYPVIYAEENGSGIEITEEQAKEKRKVNGIGRSDQFYSREEELKTKPVKEEGETRGQESVTANSNLTCTQTYYSLDKDKSYFQNEEFLNMIFQPYYGFNWLSSRCVNCHR